MDVNLHCLEAGLQDDCRAVFDILKATLQYPATPEAKAAKLAEDIRFVCGARDDGREVGAVLMDVWCLVIDIASCVPPDHPWQLSLAQAVDALRRREDRVIENNEELLWRDLPDLSMFAREKLDDPACFDADETEYLRHTKNQTSFLARLTSLGIREWDNFPIWMLRDALEEPAAKGPPMESRLWVATEWMIKCADVVFEVVGAEGQLDEKLARPLKGGSLCANVAPASLERWAFWKKRFAELAADVKGLEVDDSIGARITDALKRMDEVEKVEK